MMFSVGTAEIQDSIHDGLGIELIILIKTLKFTIICIKLAFLKAYKYFNKALWYLSFNL